MSAAFFNQLKHLAMQYTALQRSCDELAERVLALEAEKPPADYGKEFEKAVAELAEQAGPMIVRRKPGRPPKGQA